MVYCNQLPGRREQRAFELRQATEARLWAELRNGGPIDTKGHCIFGSRRDLNACKKIDRRDKKLEEHRAIMKSHQSTSDYEDKELLPKGLYVLTLKKVGDPQPSTFTKKNGEPAADYSYLTFEAEDQNGEYIGDFDSVYPYELWATLNKDGSRKRTSGLQELAEAFLDREIDGEEDIDLYTDIVRPKRKAMGTVVVATSKDGTKQFNKIESILPMPRRRKSSNGNGNGQPTDEFDKLAVEHGETVVGAARR